MEFLKLVLFVVGGTFTVGAFFFKVSGETRDGSGKGGESAIGWWDYFFGVWCGKRRREDVLVMQILTKSFDMTIFRFDCDGRVN